ncbi:MAG: B12-binding domain-containing radical SAM protein [Bacteroidota bacterium]|nr:B12-binding domain-containing radical SAM protein [Bacteroidota bacterium]
MNILLVYPQCPDSYWSFRHALRFISKKAAVPPLGLITVSAMLPATWQKKLVDMNVTPLQTKDIVWADYVFISAMNIQKDSVNQVIGECHKHRVKMIGGGPLFTQESENFPQIDHFILNEAEITLPRFLEDLTSGRPLQKTYRTNEYADIKRSPVPDYHLLLRSDYASMNIQVSRGCPFTCDFCEITALLGHEVRMKDTSQILKELDALYNLNWRGPVSIVDDNFIGNKKEVKYNLLPAMKKWMQLHHFPFAFGIQSSINMADDEELMTLMIETGFNHTFIGIETPEKQSLQECNKLQNKNRDLLLSVKKIQKAGFQVSGGFIVGFDSDSPSVFQRQIDFIQQSGIVSAMVGLLNAPKNTKLYERLNAENRLINGSTGNNTDFTLNFIPKMNPDELLEGYKSVIRNIYEAKPYYQRIRQFLLNYNKPPSKQIRIQFSLVTAFFRSIIIIGIVTKGRGEFWKFLIWTLVKRPGSFLDAMIFTVYGYHYRVVYGLSQNRNMQ